MTRPTLIPGLPRAWRTPVELQLGLDPDHAVRIELADPRTAEVLDLLDGTRPERLVLLDAAERGVPPGDARRLLDTLRDAGLILPAESLLPATLPAAERQRLLGEAAALAIAARVSGDPHAHPARALRRRRAAQVVLRGRGRLGAPLAVALAEAGVGHVHPDLTGAVGPAELAGGPLRAADVGGARRAAVAAAVARTVPATQVRGTRRMPATLVVQLAHDEPTALIAAAYAARRQPHLALGIRDGAGVVGPLVPATGGPCLYCLDLHRHDRDPDWPGPPAPEHAEPCAVATVLAAAAYATAEVLTFLDGGRPATAGAVVEIRAPGQARRRTWTPHPHCSCQSGRRNNRTFVT
ncbi:hypothetical protein [Actinoplanes sp. NPDC051851]|uniref:ThiF family adenylyltransferase n=1 Tax=Actinoplanes sp. NPDC051851 TaxID=3154753 RepID=UPI0034123AAC